MGAAHAVRWLRVAGLAALLGIFTPAVHAGGEADPRIDTVGGDAAWAMRYYDRTSATPGPTVLVLGGVHGNEPAGSYAADQIRRWPITRGRLVVMPRTNEDARRAFKRRTPGVPRDLGDLNRNFPRAGKDEPARGERAVALWAFLRAVRPHWVIDLHEGFDFNVVNPKSVGSSIIRHPTEEGAAAAEAMAAAVNATIDDPNKRFTVLKGIVNGAVARAAGEHLAAHAMIIETTTKSQARSLRVRQHRIAVHALLERLKMIDPRIVHADTVRDPARPEGRAVALYDAGGSAGAGVPNLWRQMRATEGLDPMRIGPDEIRAGVLDQHDLVIFSGGTGGGQARALRAIGRDRVRAFVRRGGGYVGICAGAYLALRGFSWGLGLLDGKTVSSKWRRGGANLKVALTDDGRKILGHDAESVTLRYHNGPVFKSVPGSLGPYRTLATFEEEIAKGDAPKGVMVGTAAVAAGTYHKGRVVVFSPHPEQTKGFEHFVMRAVAWVGARKAEVPRRAPGAPLAASEWQALKDQARDVLAAPTRLTDKRAVLTRLLRDGTPRAWTLLTELARKQAEHVEAVSAIRAENWEQTKPLIGKPLPHGKKLATKISKLLDGNHGYILRDTRRALAMLVDAFDGAPLALRARFYREAQRASQVHLRIAVASAVVRDAVARDAVPSLPKAQDARVRLARLAALSTNADWAEQQVREGLTDDNWAVRLLAARVAKAQRFVSTVPLLIDALEDARPRLGRELGATLRALTGQNFEAHAPVWRRWQAAGRSEPAPAPAADAPARRAATFYGLPLESERVCFLIDTSGSMAEPGRALEAATDGDEGEPPSRLAVAKRELRRAISQLPSTAHFNIVAFSSAVASWEEQPVRATQANRERAYAWIDGWRADGNTTLWCGMRAAFRMAGMDPLEDVTPPLDTIVVLSDGRPTYYWGASARYQKTSELLRWVRRYNEHRLLRIHAVSITSGEKSAFLNTLAAEHDGHFVAH